MRNYEPLILQRFEISGLAAEGVAIGRHEGKVVFVPYAAPGDIADIRIVRKKKQFMQGIIQTLIVPSPIRTEPVCSHFGLCGGCKWQHIPYDHQLKFKEEQVHDQFTRIGKVQSEKAFPILGSPQTTGYRNKLEYTFSSQRWLTNLDEEGAELRGAGFHIPGRFDKVLDLERCYLQDGISDRIRIGLRDFGIRNNFTFYNLKRHGGFLRTLVIRTTLSGQVMAILAVGEDKPEWLKMTTDFLSQTFPEISSLYAVVNLKKNDSFEGLEPLLVSGTSHITEELGGLKFRISPRSFFQTNPKQAGNLFEKVREYCGLNGSENVYDLYCGTGTISLFLARHSKKVTGIEYVPEAVADAYQNAELNGIANVSFHAGDMAKVFTPDFAAEHGRPDVIVLDPPRAGVAEPVLDQIIAIRPPRIVYVSCNPATQARDIAYLSDYYRLKIIQPLDMFPHTSHVENIALLEQA